MFYVILGLGRGLRFALVSFCKWVAESVLLQPYLLSFCRVGLTTGGGSLKRSFAGESTVGGGGSMTAGLYTHLYFKVQFPKPCIYV